MNWIDLLKINLFIFILSFFFYCEKKYPILKEESREKLATLRFSNFKRVQYKGTGEKKWELHSEEAYIYTENNQKNISKIIVYNFVFNQYLPRVSNIKAKKAIINYAQETMLVEGDAVYKDPDIQIQSAKLEYSINSEYTDTKDSVKITRKNIEMECLKGFYYDRKKGTQVCRKPSGKFTQKKNDKNKNEFFF